MRMNTINRLALGLVLMAGFASCEMKDELLGKKGEFGDVGFLSLDIATSTAGNTVTTKGTTDQIDDFPVIITGTNVDTTLNFASFADLKDKLPIELPVGTYSIEAHSPGEYANEMSEPYYGGTENVTITKDSQESHTVTCSIQNVKITINYTATFLNTYNSWEITVNDGKTNGRTKTYSNTDSDASSPTPVYWKLDEGTEVIYVNGYAIHGTSGERVTISETIYKRNTIAGEDNPDGGDANYFIGGDELVIGFNPVTVEGSTPGVEKDGIEITVSGFNSETNATIEIEVDGTGDSSAITIELPADITYSISGGDAPASADAVITAPKGIKSVIVKIVAGNTEFGGILAQLKLGEETFVDGVDIVDNTNLETLFAGLEMPVSAPTSGMTEPYTFPIGNFFTFLNMTGATDAGKTHQFVIEVTDMENNKNSDTLNVTINE